MVGSPQPRRLAEGRVHRYGGTMSLGASAASSTEGEVGELRARRATTRRNRENARAPNGCAHDGNVGRRGDDANAPAIRADGQRDWGDRSTRARRWMTRIGPPRV